MWKVNLAHYQAQGIDFAVFDANARSNLDRDRSILLQQLVVAAQQAGLHVQKAALVFQQAGRLTYFGSPDLVRYLSQCGPPRWTHTIDV